MKILSYEMTAGALKVSALALGREHRFIARDFSGMSKMLAKTDGTLNSNEAGEQLLAFVNEQDADKMAMAA